MKLKEGFQMKFKLAWEILLESVQLSIEIGKLKSALSIEKHTEKWKELRDFDFWDKESVRR